MVAAPRPSRPLPTGGRLPPEDYRRLVGVLESVDRAPDLPAFLERLIGALERWFGFTTLAVLHGRTLAEALLEGRGVHRGYTRACLDEYAARWMAADPFLTPAAWELLTARGVVTLDDLRGDGARAGTPAHQNYVEGFLRSHGITNKVGTVVEGGAAGVVFVGVSVHGVSRVPERDLAVLHALRRHLAPLAAGQLSRDRAGVGARRDWRLTSREREVAALAAEGLTNQQIASRLFVGVDTVKKHLTRVLAETGCAGRTQLAVRWQLRRYLEQD